MQKDLEIYVDHQCEVHDLLTPIATGDFWDLDAEPVRPGAVYVIGRLELARCKEKVRSLLDKAHVMFSNPAEGSDTMMGQFQHLGIIDLAESNRIMVLAGGDMDPKFTYFKFDSFAYRLANFEENRQCMNSVDAIFSKKQKPYKFLFLNGRMRTHRKWMLARLRQLKLLNHSLYTCLHSRNAPRGGLTLIEDGRDLMDEVEPIHYLDKYYEVDRYRERLDSHSDERNVKFHLFRYQDKPEWGEAYLKPEPYIDTYFSLVSETVFHSKYSFRTEKIWKPIMMGHPWIAMANPGFYRDLKNIGFKTFESLIDESFDDIHDPQKRIERIAQVVNELCNSNLEDFLSQCWPICKYNQQRMLEYQQDQVQQFPGNLINFIKTHIHE